MQGCTPIMHSWPGREDDDTMVTEDGYGHWWSKMGRCCRLPGQDRDFIYFECPFCKGQKKKTVYMHIDLYRGHPNWLLVDDHGFLCHNPDVSLPSNVSASGKKQKGDKRSDFRHHHYAEHSNEGPPPKTYACRINAPVLNEDEEQKQHRINEQAKRDRASRTKLRQRLLERLRNCTSERERVALRARLAKLEKYYARRREYAKKAREKKKEEQRKKAASLVNRGAQVQDRKEKSIGSAGREKKKEKKDDQRKRAATVVDVDDQVRVTKEKGTGSRRKKQKKEKGSGSGRKTHRK